MTAICQSEVAIRELAAYDDAYLNTNWSLPKYFGHIKVLTLDPEAERFKQFLLEIAKVGLTKEAFEIAPGITGSKLPQSLWSRMSSWDIRKKLVEGPLLQERQKGQTGCYMAQFRAIAASKESYQKAVANLKALQAQKTSPEALAEAEKEVKKYSSLLLIEDNNGFGRVCGPKAAQMEDTGRRFRLAMKDLAPSWDMFYFMAMKEATKVTENLAKLKNGVVTKCYAINAKFYDRILEMLAMSIEDRQFEPVDDVIAYLHPTANCYVAIPALTYRSASLSQVGGHLHKKVVPKAEELNHWQAEINLVK